MADTPSPAQRDYDRLKALESLLMSDPERRKNVEKMIRDADPKAKLPWLDQQEATEKLVAERTKAIEDEMKALKQRQAEREYAEDKQRIKTRLKRAPFNLDDDDIKAVEELVNQKYKEGEVLSMETAARYYISQHSPVVGGSAPARTPFSSRLNRPKNDFRKALKDPKSEIFTNTKNYIAKEFDQAWDEGLEIINQQGLG